MEASAARLGVKVNECEDVCESVTCRDSAFSLDLNLSAQKRHLHFAAIAAAPIIECSRKFPSRISSLRSRTLLH